VRALLQGVSRAFFCFCNDWWAAGCSCRACRAEARLCFGISGSNLSSAMRLWVHSQWSCKMAPVNLALCLSVPTERTFVSVILESSLPSAETFQFGIKSDSDEHFTWRLNCMSVRANGPETLRGNPQPMSRLSPRPAVTRECHPSLTYPEAPPLPHTHTHTGVVDPGQPLALPRSLVPDLRPWRPFLFRPPVDGGVYRTS
jgi:hypothetical protein